jgi:hypothetical protein
VPEEGKLNEGGGGLDKENGSACRVIPE